MFTALIALMIALGTPCATEDAANCYWDAQTTSNQTGQSFVDLNGLVIYLEGK